MVTVEPVSPQGSAGMQPGMPPGMPAPDAGGMQPGIPGQPQTIPPQGGHNQGGDAQFSVSFDKADVQSVIKIFSMLAQTPIVVAPDLKGNVTIISYKKMTLPEVYEVIGAALRVRGYTMLGALGSKVIRVVPLKKAITEATSVTAGKELAPGVLDQDVITQVIPLDFASSDTLRDQLKPLVSSDQASVVSVSNTNTLILTDSASNVRKLMEVVKTLDKDITGVLAVEVYACKYASADNLVSSLNALFQPKATPGQAAQQGGRGGRGGQGQPGMPGAPPGAEGQPGISTEGLAYLKGQITFTADTRTNRLLISGTKDRIAMVLDVIAKLDVDTEPEVKVKFFPLKYGDAQAVATQLNNLFEQPQGSTNSNRGGFAFLFGGGGGGTQSTDYAGLKRNVIVADIRTNSVIVTATEQNMKSFESMIKELDAPKDVGEVTRVYPLKYAKAADLAATLTQLFRGNTAGGGRFGLAAIFGLGNNQNTNGPLQQLQQITVIAEPKSNSLLITGPPNSASLTDTLIAQLDKRTAQVFIEVAIVDVTLDKNTQFGVEWQWHGNDADAKGTPDQSAATDFGLAAESTGLKYSVLSGNLKALLRALQTKSNVRVLSTPTITTADNVQAKISIGQDQPFVSETSETTGGSLRNTVSFRNVAIALTVTPHVNGSSEVIALDVQQTINEIIGRDTRLDAPIIANREAITSVSVRDGQTIVIGGIMKDNKTRITKGVPLLSEIPIIGELFKSTENQNTRSELMVFLTPRILKTDQDVADVTNQTKEMLSVQPLQGVATQGAAPQSEAPKTP